MAPVTTLLIANRGEIARRLIRTAHRLGMATVAVYSEDDAAAPHVREATVARPLGPGGYLDVDRLVEIARETGADAVHPGYGFLSENADFARAVEAAGLAFVGPTPAHIEMFGSKSRARELAIEAGVPVVPGSGIVSSEDDAVAEAARIGYPIAVKAVGGGGGVGVEMCDDEGSLRSAFAAVGGLAERHFGTPGVFLEKRIVAARHVEVQVLGDGAGAVIALGDRDCSIQRRHQKVVEESPAPGLSAAQRERLAGHAVRLAQAVGYRSAGTVEFLVAGDEEWFLEANTRLQVEHPVTEEVFGVDIVEAMLAIAAGEPAAIAAAEAASPAGHAIEVRLCAEDPGAGFRPSSGLLTRVEMPSGDSVRVECGVEPGDVVTTRYDSLLAKIIVAGADRAEALARLAEALDAVRVDGIETNLALLRAVASHPEVVAGGVDTSLLERVAVTAPRIEVARGGMSTTVQDWPGRVGYWQVGVAPSGPFDDLSFRQANRAVGNPEGVPALEATMLGPALRFTAPTIVCVTGAPVPVTVDGVAVPQWAPVEVPAGAVLDIGTPDQGARTYVAVRGGLDVPTYLGSASTFTAGGFGGHGGRALTIGDVLHAGDAAERDPAPVPDDARPVIGATWDLHVAEGPQPAPEYFTPDSIADMYAATWRVHVHAARTGVRLIGPRPRWSRTDGGEAGLHPSNLHDNPYSVGAINFTGDTPSILGPDGPSLGGFACPLTVVSADRWKLGQLRPGDEVRLVPVDESQHPAVEEARIAAVPLVPAVSRRDADHGVLARRDARDDAPAVVYRRGGDDNLLVEYGPMELDLGLRMRVHALMTALQEEAPAGLIDVTPGVRSLHIHVDAATLGTRRLLGLLQDIEDRIPETDALAVPSRRIELPMSWDDPVVRAAIARYEDLVRDDAPWNPSNLEFMRRINGLDSVEQVRDIVFSADYMVLGLGDVYLGAPAATPVDPRHRLVTTKYNPARTWTAEGTVGIGGSYMCIYGMDSPGGYQLVGRTIPIWAGLKELRRNFEPGHPWLLRFFDRVRFVPVSPEELDDARAAMRADRLELPVEEGEFSMHEHRAFLAREAASIADFRARQAEAFAAERDAWEAAGEFAERESAPAALEASQAAAVPDGCVAIEAPMTGAVWRHATAPGDAVDHGDPIIVLEAMKMEMPVLAPARGTVETMLAAPGATVTAGQVLAVVRPHS